MVNEKTKELTLSLIETALNDGILFEIMKDEYDENEIPTSINDFDFMEIFISKDGTKIIANDNDMVTIIIENNSIVGICPIYQCTSLFIQNDSAVMLQSDDEIILFNFDTKTFKKLA